MTDKASEYEDVTPAQVARDIQACVNQAMNAMVEISCLAGDEFGPEFETAMGHVHAGLECMTKVCDKVRNEE